MKKIDFISNVSKTNWLNVLPDLQNKKVLIIGTDSIDIIKAIFYSDVASLRCVGIPHGELENVVSKYYRNVNNIGEKLDVIIFDEVMLLGPINTISGILYKLKGLLNKAGVLLVRCPDGWRNLKYRYFIIKALQIESKWADEYFICSPSSSTPYSIIPYINDKAWLTYNYPIIEEKTFNIKILLKEKIKKCIFRILGKYNPLSGLIITINNSCEIEKNNPEVKEIKPIVKICIAYHYSNKHYLFDYGRLDKKLRSMKKIEYNPSGSGNHLEKEYKNLLLFKDYIDIYDNNGIVIPQAVYFKKLPDRHESSMTVVSGVSLKYLVEKNIYLKSTDNVIELLNRATDMQICFQKLTENNLNNIIYNMDPEYFRNYLELNMQNIDFDVTCIQHCDFAANNIHLDVGTYKWGIIDWEGLTQGMPLMLDLFSMFTSFRFTVGNKKYNDFQEKYYDAIIDTYFSDNWISRCVFQNLKKYCLANKVPEENIYNNFVLFLLFQTNKYRIFKVYDYQRLFERILKFAIANDDKFIIEYSTES